MTAKKRGRKPSVTNEQVLSMRKEYQQNPRATIEYLADKYGRSTATVRRIVSNIDHHDPSYVPPKKHGGYHKGLIYLPDHIEEAKDMLTPAPTTAHRARGQNYVINRFK